MEPLTIENAKTRFFESKENYLKFKQAWKDFHNEGKVVWREDVEVYSWSERKNVIMKNVKHTSLSAEHYMLYNLLRGYDISRGFSEDSEHGWDACHIAARAIHSAAKALQNVNKSSFSSVSSRKQIECMLLPFGGTVSHEALRDIGEMISINIMNNQNFPQFEIEEWRDPEPEPVKQSIADKLKAWRTA